MLKQKLEPFTTSYTMPQQTDKPGNPFVEDRPGNPFAEAKAGNASAPFLATAGIKLADMALDPGELAGDTLAGGSALLQAIPGLLTDRGFDYENRFTEEQQKFPASLLRALPGTDFGDASSFFRSIPEGMIPGGETFSESFSEERAAFDADQTARREQHPVKTMLGEVAADVTALGMLRQPGVGTINRIETFIMNKGMNSEMIFGNLANLLKARTGAAELANIKIVQSKGLRSLIRGTGRAVETGVDAAILDILNGDSPSETAAYAFGTQLGLSAGTEGLKRMLSGGPGSIGKKLAVAAGLTAFIWQAAQQTTPGGGEGGKDAGLDVEQLGESVKFGIDKTLLAAGIGVAAAVAGGGRLRTSSSSSEFARTMPRAADFVATLPRGAMVSMIERLVDAPPEERQVLLQQLEQAQTDPMLAEELFSLGSKPPNLQRPHP